jgi:hypothetical protein
MRDMFMCPIPDEPQAHLRKVEAILGRAKFFQMLVVLSLEGGHGIASPEMCIGSLGQRRSGGNRLQDCGDARQQGDDGKEALKAADFG